MDTLWQDLKYGARQLARSPGFTVVAVLTLALGIGVNASVLSVINSVLLRPLPVDDTEGLVFVHRWTPERLYHGHSYPEYEDYLQSDAFTGITAYALKPLVFGDGDQTKQVFGEVVTGNYFSVLNVHPAFGRLLSPQDDRLAAPPVIVVSHPFWVRHLGEDPAWAGKTVVVNGQPFTVVGVAPREFTGTTAGISTDLWMPMVIWAQTVGEQYRLSPSEGFGHQWLDLVGRLKPNRNREQTEIALTTVAHRRETQSDAKAAALRIALTPVDGGNPGLRSELWGGGGAPVLIGFLALCGVVLLIPCANVANLLLARAATRQHEIAVRLALGSSRARLIRQLLTESLLLALLAGMAGLLIAVWATDLIGVFESPVPFPTLALSLKLDWRVLGSVFLLSLATGVVFGLLPALECSKLDLAASLKTEISLVAARTSRFRLRDLVVVSQVTVSLVLLILGGLFARGLLRGFLVDPGFHSDNVLLLSLDPTQFGGAASKVKGFDRLLLERLRELPGVESASVVTPVPLSFGGSYSYYTVEGSNEFTERRLPSTLIGPGYFSTTGIPLVRGRDFSFGDVESSPWVAIVNETMAQQYWSGQDPIGKRIRHDVRETWIEIVGVARDAKYQSLGEPPQPWLYLPAFQHPEDAGRGLTLLVRTAGLPMALAPEVRRAVRDIDASFPVLSFQTLGESVEIQYLVPRIGAAVVGGIGFFGLLLATVGLFGVMSYTVTQRTREIGVRMALGAQDGHVLRLVIGQGLTLATIGVVLGAAAAFALSLLLFRIPYLSYLLFGISPVDPVTFAACITLIIGVALGACWAPARRAMRVDPMTVLRYE